MTDQQKRYRVGTVDVTKTELIVLMVFDTAVWDANNYSNSGGQIIGFAKTSKMISLIKTFYGTTEKDAEIIIKSVGNKLFNTEKGKSDNLKKFYPGHGVFIKDEFMKDFGCGRGVFRLGSNHFNNDCDAYIVKKEETQKHNEEKNIATPHDIHGDIHLMAMTILEKLQPVLLNAIYTELMEHKK